MVRSRALILVMLACASSSAACGGVGTLTGSGGTSGGGGRGGRGMPPGTGGMSGGGIVSGIAGVTGRAGAEWYLERESRSAPANFPRGSGRRACSSSSTLPIR